MISRSRLEIPMTNMRSRCPSCGLESPNPALGPPNQRDPGGAERPVRCACCGVNMVETSTEVIPWRRVFDDGVIVEGPEA